MTGGLGPGVMRNFEGIVIFIVEGIKTLGFSGPLSRPGAEITSSSELESSPEAGS